MSTEELRNLVVLILLIEHLYTAGTKILIIVLMLMNREKAPLDWAVIVNQSALASRMVLWFTVLALPGSYDAHLREWLYVWLVVAALVAVSVTWLLVELWRERIRPMWKDWRFKWRGQTGNGSRSHMRQGSTKESLNCTAKAAERTADATERIADREP